MHGAVETVGKLGAAMGVFHQFDAVAVGIGEPGLKRAIKAAAYFSDGYTARDQRLAKGGQSGDFEAKVLIAVSGVERGGIDAPLPGGEALVEKFDEGGVASRDVGPEDGSVGGAETEFHR